MLNATVSKTPKELLTEKIDKLVLASSVKANKRELIGLMADKEALKIALERPEVLNLSIEDFVRNVQTPLNSTSSHRILAHLIAMHSDDATKRELLKIEGIPESKNLMGITTGQLILYSCGPELRLEILMSPWLHKKMGITEYTAAKMIVESQDETGLIYIASNPRILALNPNENKRKEGNELIWLLVEKAPAHLLLKMAQDLPIEMLQLTKTTVTENPVILKNSKGEATSNKGTILIKFTITDAMKWRESQLGSMQLLDILDERLEKAGKFQIEDLLKMPNAGSEKASEINSNVRSILGLKR